MTYVNGHSRGPSHYNPALRREIEEAAISAAAGPVHTYKLSPEELAAELDRLGVGGITVPRYSDATKERARELLRNGNPVTVVAHQLRMSTGTLWRLHKELSDAGEITPAREDRSAAAHDAGDGDWRSVARTPELTAAASASRTDSSRIQQAQEAPEAVETEPQAQSATPLTFGVAGMICKRGDEIFLATEDGQLTTIGEPFAELAVKLWRSCPIRPGTRVRIKAVVEEVSA